MHAEDKYSIEKGQAAASPRHDGESLGQLLISHQLIRSEFFTLVIARSSTLAFELTEPLESSTMPDLTNRHETIDSDFIEPREDKKAYRFHLLITKKEDNLFSAFALNLPGAGSCGESEAEAIANAEAEEAVVGVIESYLETGSAIPWKETSGITYSEGGLDK